MQKHRNIASQGLGQPQQIDIGDRLLYERWKSIQNCSGITLPAPKTCAHWNALLKLERDPSGHFAVV